MPNKIVKKIFLFFAFVAAIFIAIASLFSHTHLVLKCLIFSLGVIISIIAFYMMQKLNLSEQQTDEFVEDIMPNNYQAKYLLCPKCLKPYDGILCFHCGYKKENRQEE